MRYFKWLGVIAFLGLIISAFLPWIFIQSINTTVTGIDSGSTNFGKPAYLHLLLGIFFIIFNFLPRLWAKRVNLLIVALNIAWAARNYFILTACQAGECPEPRIGLFLMLGASFAMLLAALFPDMKVPDGDAGK